MEAIFKIEPQEFNEELFLRLKKLFKGKTVTISFSTDIDETTYLTMNPVNNEHLLESMSQEPHISFTSEEFKEKISKL
jgi:hypothetical protein